MSDDASSGWGGFFIGVAVGFILLGLPLSCLMENATHQYDDKYVDRQYCAPTCKGPSHVERVPDGTGERWRCFCAEEPK